MKHFVLSLALVSLAGCTTLQSLTQDPESAQPQQSLSYTRTNYAALPHWGDDTHAEALSAFLKSCDVLAKKDPSKPLGPEPRWGTNAQWQLECTAARLASDAKSFFETRFTPVAVTGSDGLFTGYYEASLEGSRTQHGPFQTPVYTKPGDLLTADLGAFSKDLKGKTIRGRVDGGKFIPYPDRAWIESAKLDAPVLAWVRDPVDVFFLHIQGSGRITLDDGTIMRVGYAEQNGHSYVPIGRVLKERGELTEVSMETIRAWLAQHPDKAQAIMNENPSYIFFTELSGTDGPKGAQGVAVTPLRSLAVDKSLYGYGTPFYIATDTPALKRLMIAQDTGGAIKGPIRADVFWGYGAEAAAQAGPMQSKGQWWMLLPNAVAQQLP